MNFPGQDSDDICDNEDYPSVKNWSYIVVEGYCMLNLRYSSCKDPHMYRLKDDLSLEDDDLLDSFEEVPNNDYDPDAVPDPYPDGCPKRVSPDCIRCPHFGWCSPDDDITEKIDTVISHYIEEEIPNE
ncbi:hypothetical protein [Methanoplanus endosymbiosus]|uniref:Uncharacterized protein n=1 Tax=Methanoplanus endosymbiosus TaxID=33865 RepID=A0A9E7PL57_9EURY|nr:hypothetical protein [Methanoplanus endosymbiosus]UUX92195.1 hypothetical protein L6E24_12680 [Methanoplanus endosymbiosus]